MLKTKILSLFMTLALVFSMFIINAPEVKAAGYTLTGQMLNDLLTANPGGTIVNEDGVSYSISGGRILILTQGEFILQNIDNSFNAIDIESGAAIIDGSNINPTHYVNNYGTISGGTFNTPVTSHQNTTINGGIFNKSVFINDQGQIHDGTFNARVEIRGSATIHGGTFNGMVKNHGSILGGTFNGVIDNEGSSATISNDITLGSNGSFGSNVSEFAYVFKNGENQTIAYDKTATFELDAPFGVLSAVEVDGDVIDASNYTLSKGSIIVTLSSAYVKSLSVGAHNITFRLNHGNDLSTTFTTSAAPVEEPSDNSGTTPSNQNNRWNYPYSGLSNYSGL